ncbi:P-loop containing nucleoside triphosphate hydrolase protein [Melanomma pulvis-pyrius CBS 109.77]|uniref:P-loop containing nucleoside triphosphate hydrolase protein n=1 Tax=Melanomma pulvis-pyrius CBS 109.77 TaxID=1314802 RepID=A0A6A6X7Z4_9PLEO|nr:P-loop containing nucleoside triphosphate hydrolase protein [Melanomma pulvis-pyrius CBS 109.77]
MAENTRTPPGLEALANHLSFTLPQDTDPAESNDTARHAIIKYEIYSIIIQSPFLKNALSSILDGYLGMCCNMDRLIFNAPFEPFVHRWGALIAYIENHGLDEVTQEHMGLLHEVLKKEIGGTTKVFEDYVANGVLTHEHTWIVFQPDSTVALRLKSEAYVDGSEYTELPEFSGAQPINKLPIFPLEFHPGKKKVKLDRTERGKRFAAWRVIIIESNYDGLAIERTSDDNNLIHNKGRITVDTNRFCKQPDQFKTFTVPLSTSSKAPSDIAKLTNYQHMLCTQILCGRSIKSKKWCNNAFKNLVLPKTQKKLILALSKNQAASANNFDHVISGKEKGMILLISGLLGVGQILTAEAVSENMRVPLFMMSAGYLGLRPEEFEMNLENILEMVSKWKEILLIDECDVFLEARSIHEIDRNRLVSTFLRLPEYYQGTLFLLKDRADNMDPAFQSRFHLHMKQIKNLVKIAQLSALEDQKVLGKEHIVMVFAIEDGFKEEEAKY